MVIQRAVENKKLINEDVSLVLDLIRGVSAQMVVIGHLLSFLKIYPNSNTLNPLYIQNVGVVIFFILSGFLISYSLLNKLRNQQYTFKEYFIERFSRIYSGFIPSLFLILLIDFINVKINMSDYTHGEAFNLITFLGNLLMLQDFPFSNFITSFGSGRVLWTLAIEWWLYLFFGYLLLFKRERLNIAFKSLILLFLSIVPIYNLIGGRGNGLTIVWFSGVVITILLMRCQLKIKNYMNFVFAIGLFIISVFWFFYSNYEAYNLMFSALITGSFYFFLNGLRETNYFDNSKSNFFIKEVANYSFTLYLIHYSLIELMLVVFKNANIWILFSISFLISNVLAYVVANLTEYKHRSFSNLMKNKFLKNG